MAGGGPITREVCPLPLLIDCDDCIALVGETMGSSFPGVVRGDVMGSNDCKRMKARHCENRARGGSINERRAPLVSSVAWPRRRRWPTRCPRTLSARRTRYRKSLPCSNTCRSCRPIRWHFPHSAEPVAQGGRSQRTDIAGDRSAQEQERRLEVKQEDSMIQFHPKEK